MQAATVVSPFLGAEHAAFRETVRRFVREEVTPFANDWDEAETFPRELYGKAAAIGLLGLGFPEEFGGVEADVFFHIILSEELAASGCGGVSASLMSHSIGAPPIAKFGSPELQRRVLPSILAGEAISALAITEPSGGLDVAALKTTARLGSTGFMRGSRAERIYREVKVMMIGGGSEEIMKDRAARQLGW